MELQEAIVNLKKAISKKYIIVIFCSCEVEYNGRAKSFIAQGDRMVIIKHDNTLLVHRPDGRSPVNWMPQNSTITASVEKNVLT